MNIRQSIKLGMAYKGVRSQKELSDITGINTATLSNIINSKSDPSIRTIEKIALSLGYTASEFCKLGE